MTQQELADAARWKHTKVSKIENGKQLPTDADLELWAAVTNTGAAQLEQWRAQLAEANELYTSFSRRMAEGQAPVQLGYNQLIEDNTIFRFAEMVWVPRFLQTPEYTRAVLSLIHEKYGTTDDVEEAVAVRQSSVQYLFDQHRRFELILHEGILRSGWPTPEIMRGQLDRLQSVLGLPNVRLGIYPLDRPVAQPMTGSFELYGDTCYVDIVIDDEKKTLGVDVGKYNKEMDALWRSAAEGDEARAIISEIQRTLYR
jgi:transcriptional regulator with XRE-family HTH domain